MKYTIRFNFPLGLVYPTKSTGFTNEFDKNVKTWSNRIIAELFANEICGKYQYEIIEIKDKK